MRFIYAALIGILMLLASMFTSCASSKSKRSVKTDSVVVKKETVDSTVRIDSSNLTKTVKTEIVKSDSSKTKENTETVEEIEETQYDTSGKVTYKKVSKKKTSTKKEVDTGGLLFVTEHSKIDSSNYTKEVDLSKTKSDSVHYEKTETSKEKKSFSVGLIIWLLLLAVIIYWAYRRYINFK